MLDSSTLRVYFRQISCCITVNNADVKEKMKHHCFLSTNAVNMDSGAANILFISPNEKQANEWLNKHIKSKGNKDLDHDSSTNSSYEDECKHDKYWMLFKRPLQLPISNSHPATIKKYSRWAHSLPWWDSNTTPIISCTLPQKNAHLYERSQVEWVTAMARGTEKMRDSFSKWCIVEFELRMDRAIIVTVCQSHSPT